MNIKTIAALASALIATSVMADNHKEKKCGAGSCSKKTAAAGAASGASDAACSKKEAGCSKKDKAHTEAKCSKKDAGCSKK